MITGYIIGDKALVARLKAMPERVQRDMVQTVTAWGYRLQADIQGNYLTGQVFKVRTGRLRASIAQGGPDTRSRVEATGNSVFAYVGTNVEYAAPLFYGRQAVDIVPVKAKALHFTINGEGIFAKRVHQPARPGKDVLSMSLEKNKQAIIADFQATLFRSMQGALNE